MYLPTIVIREYFLSLVLFVFTERVQWVRTAIPTGSVREPSPSTVLRTIVSATEAYRSVQHTCVYLHLFRNNWTSGSFSRLEFCFKFSSQLENFIETPNYDLPFIHCFSSCKRNESRVTLFSRRSSLAARDCSLVTWRPVKSPPCVSSLHTSALL